MLVNIHHAKTNLSKLIAQVQADQEEIIIGKAGKPVAKLVIYTPDVHVKPGVLKGKIKLANNFDEEDQTINQLFYGQK